MKTTLPAVSVRGRWPSAIEIGEDAVTGGTTELPECAVERTLPKEFHQSIELYQILTGINRTTQSCQILTGINQQLNHVYKVVPHAMKSTQTVVMSEDVDDDLSMSSGPPVPPWREHWD